MKLSVVIAVYNDPKIQKCLESLSESRDTDFEVIVVDDGSTKIDIKGIVERFSFCRLFVFEKNKGPAVARNYGVKQSKSDIVFFMDSDAMVYPDTLVKIVNRFEADRTLDGITILWSDEPVEDNFFNRYKAVEMNYMFKNYFVKTCGTNGSAFKKKVFWSVGGFDEGFKTANAEDFHFGFKIFSRNYRVIFDNEILMKNAYYDKFFFSGIRKYCSRAFLRAIVLYQVRNRMETTYNSKKFQLLYLLAISSFMFLVGSMFLKALLFPGLAAAFAFFYANRGLYGLFFKKYGVVFFFWAVLLHYVYIVSVAFAGCAGLVFAFVTNKKRELIV